MRLSKRALYALAALSTNIAFVETAYAQQGAAVLTGKVEDAATRQPVPDVVVTVTSPNLQGEQIVVTDATGSYRIPNLPSGEYTLRLDKEQYKPYSRSGITLRSDVTIRVDAQLLPESLKSEEIVVVGRAPTVDVGSSSTGVSINSDFTRRIPVAAPTAKGAANRSFEAIAEVAPQAAADNYGTSINGTTSPENSYVVDGLTVNNPAFGIIGTPLSSEFVGEVNIITGGYMPEYGKSTGGILNAVTKSGSNEFHGSVWGFYTPGAFEGARKQVRREGNTISSNTKLAYQGDIGFDLGGPIVKDKLWFYVGMDFSATAYNLDRELYRTKVQVDPNTGDVILDSKKNPKPVLVDPNDPNSGSVVEQIPGTFSRYKATLSSWQTLAKLTYTIDENNKLILTGTIAPVWSGGENRFGMDPQDGKPEVTTGWIGDYTGNAHRYNGGAYDVTLKWTSEHDNKRLLFDTLVGWHHEEGGTSPSDGSTVGGTAGLAGIASASWRRNAPYHQLTDFETFNNQQLCVEKGWSCPTQTYFSGGPDFIDTRSLNRYQIREVVTYLLTGLGHHVIKGGVDFELDQYDHTKAYSGLHRLRENTGGTNFNDNRDYGFMTGPDQPLLLRSLRWKTNAVSVGGFVQDSWSILDKVTLNIGVRYDAEAIYGGDGSLGLGLPNQWSPRVGVIYDVTQEGRSKIYANYARFYESVPLDLADRAASGEPQITSYYNKSQGCDPSKPENLKNDACLSDSARRANPLVTPSNPDKKWAVTGGGKTPIDPNVTAQSSDEVVFGGEYEIIKNGRLGASYTKRWLNRAIEDMSRDEAQTYFIGNPGYGIAKDFPTAERNYDAGTLYFQKAFSEDWLAQVSYTLSYLRGNYAGLFRPETNQLDPNINSDFDLRSLLPNRTGALPGDHTHAIKLFGARDIELPSDMHVQIGGAFRAQSGGPTNFLGSHPLYGAGEAFILPRGSGDRLPWNFSVDANVGYGIKLAKSQVITITMDVFNLFNFQAATKVDQIYTNDNVLPIPGGNRSQLAGLESTDLDDNGKPAHNKAVPNPNFGRATEYQEPRQFRFGIRTTF